MHLRALALTVLPLLSQGWLPAPSQRALARASTRLGAPARVLASSPSAAGEAGDALLESLFSAARADDLMALDEAFDTIPHPTMLRINQLAAEQVSEAIWLVTAMEETMRMRMADGATKLRLLLEAGEITKMDAALCKLVREGGADYGFTHVLATNLEHARASGDTTMTQLFTHLNTRMSEELEKRAEPAVGLLHRLLRTDAEDVRERILLDFLAPKTSFSVPGSDVLIPLATPAPPKVGASEFGRAVAQTVAALSAVDLTGAPATRREQIAASVEDCRAVAKQARAVIAQHCDDDELGTFSELLGPVCTRAAARRSAVSVFAAPRLTTTHAPTRRPRPAPAAVAPWMPQQAPAAAGSP
jgi:hypothetical protein